MTNVPFSAESAVRQSQAIFAHAWMVRTFIKHSPEVDDYPELMHVVRTVFDVSRSLESRIHDPVAYFRQLRKKIHRLSEAADRFRHDAPLASTHMNFQQAVLSLDACLQAWTDMLEQFEAAKSQQEPLAANLNEHSQPEPEFDEHEVPQ